MLITFSDIRSYITVVNQNYVTFGIMLHTQTKSYCHRAFTTFNTQRKIDVP